MSFFAGKSVMEPRLTKAMPNGAVRVLYSHRTNSCERKM